ncbi:lipopolysaccharide biosynthesis protein [Flagellimonas sp. 2504JD1-5]
MAKEVLLVFFVLSVFEHLGQELFRIYIALEKVVFANILFFLRSGLWSWIVVLLLFFLGESNITLKTILLLWTVSSLIAITFGIAKLPNIKDFGKIQLDKDWIIKGVKVGASVFLATILLKVVEYSDRYLIDYFLGKKELGVYVFYFQLANIINVLVFTLYISFIYPKILKSVYDKDKLSLKKNKSEIYKSTSAIVVGMISVFVVFSSFLLDTMDKPELYTSKNIFFVLVISALFFNFSFGSHYVLIAEERENLIIKTTFMAFVVNLSLNLILIPAIGIYGASIALLLSSLALWISKLYEETQLLKKW